MELKGLQGLQGLGLELNPLELGPEPDSVRRAPAIELGGPLRHGCSNALRAVHRCWNPEPAGRRGFGSAGSPGESDEVRSW